jgi:hypothetical protein
MRAHFTPQAEIDLEEVGDYIALDNPRRCLVHSRDTATLREDCGRTASLCGASRPGRQDTDLRTRKLPYRLRAVRRRRTYTASASRCPKRARSSRQLNDPLIAIRVAWLPKHLDPAASGQLNCHCRDSRRTYSGSRIFCSNALYRGSSTKLPRSGSPLTQVIPSPYTLNARSSQANARSESWRAAYTMAIQ